MTGQPTWATVCATGHRPQHLSQTEQRWVRGELPRIVAKLRDVHGMTCGVSGMAIGTDLWWAAALVDAGVPLWAHVPFPQQLDVSAAVVAVWKRSKTDGGTASAVEKANRRGLPIIHLDPERQTVTLRSPALPAPAGVDTPSPIPAA